MDPNATLKELRECCSSIFKLPTAETTEREDRMAELFQALDDWITNGGFLPESWRAD